MHPDAITHPSSRVIIRPPREADRDIYRRARTLSRTLHEPWESTAAHRPPPGSDTEFDRLLRRTKTEARMWLGFLKDENGNERDSQLVAQASIMPISPGPAGSAYLGYWANGEHAGKGLTRETLALAIDEAFTTAGLWRIEANIVPTNTRSIHLAKSLHLRHEGTALEYLEINGSMQDHHH